ncbi:recombinase family protein [Streptomyces sp. NPDC056568]|uniref:recombinase family protein n=1 Tax=Streptomyces sp. NPDC056568 TaxID=3345866 RepID=UPI003673DC67
MTIGSFDRFRERSADCRTRGGEMADAGGRAVGDPIPVVSYARTSEDGRRKDGHGVRYQLRINERTARAHGCVVVAAYGDSGCSASREGMARPGFDRMIEALTSGRTQDGQPVAGVVCVADDRLYRRSEDLARFSAALTSAPGRVYVDPDGVRDPYSYEGLMQAVRSLDAALTETRVRSRRVANWHWARAVEGVPHSGPRPFGWLEDRITLHPDEARLVERAIEDRISGKAARAIARDWSDLGVTGTRGGRPNGQTVTQIITAPRICGYRANKGELLLAPETGEPVSGQWEPIVTPDRWRAVCGTFSPGSLFLHRGSGAPRRTTTGRGAPRHLGTGFLRCGARRSDGAVCGGALCATKGRSRRSPYAYSCRNCGRCSISGPLADSALERLLFDDARRAAVTEDARLRWSSGDMGLEEKRRTVASVLVHCLVRPGVKGQHAWDFSRLEPVRR